MNEYTTLIDLVVVAGAAVVLPVALGRGAGAWLAVAGSTALALSIGPGPLAAALAVPWLVVAAAATLAAWRQGEISLRWPSLVAVASLAAPAFAVVAGALLVESCAGAERFGFGEPITRLAVVHFTFAGTATTALGRAAMGAAAGAPAWRRRVAAAGTVAAIAAPPVVALGFWSGGAVPQVGGAVMMSIAAYLLAVGHLAEGWRARGTVAGRLLLVSGVSVWLPMLLAVAWALAQHTGGPALSIPAMTRVHGSLNAVGFVGCGLAARWLVAHPAAPTVAVDPAVAP